MNIYPWLTKTYKKIILQHKNKKAHRVLLINSVHGIGVNLLIKNIISWLICQKTQDLKSCQDCYGCKLFLAKNHPDLYTFNLKIIGIDQIRYLKDKIYNYSQHGGNKVIFIKADLLTEEASHSLLKTLENPPENSWFFITTYNINKIIPTLRSRCVKEYLHPPNLKLSLSWIKKNNNNNISDEDYTIALKMYYMSPILALELINNQWEKRKKFFYHLFSFFKKRKLFISLLKVLNDNDVIIKIKWLCSILLDAKKYSLKLKDCIVNTDQIKLIEQINFNCSIYFLNVNLFYWLKCIEKISENNLLNNKELIILETILSLKEKGI